MATITECGNPSNSFSFEPLEMWEFTPIIYLNAQPVDYDNNEDTKLVYNVDEKVALSDKISKLFRDKYTLMEFSTQSNTLTLEFEVKNGTTDQFYDEDGYIEPKIELAPNEKELTTEEYIKITGDKSFLVDYSKQETTIIKITVDMNTKTDRVFFINFYANDDKTYFDIEGAYKNVFCGQVKIQCTKTNDWEFPLEKILLIRKYAMENKSKYEGRRAYTDYHHCTDTHKHIVYKLLDNPTDLYLGKDQTQKRKTPSEYKKVGESTTDGIRDKLIGTTYAEPSKIFTVIDKNKNEVIGNTNLPLTSFKESPVEYMKSKCPSDGFYVFIGAYNDDYHSFTIIANKRDENINFEFIDQIVGVSNPYKNQKLEELKLLINIDDYSFDFPMKLELYQLRNRKK